MRVMIVIMALGCMLMAEACAKKLNGIYFGIQAGAFMNAGNMRYGRRDNATSGSYEGAKDVMTGFSILGGAVVGAQTEIGTSRIVPGIEFFYNGGFLPVSKKLIPRQPTTPAAADAAVLLGDGKVVFTHRSSSGLVLRGGYKTNPSMMLYGRVGFERVNYRLDYEELSKTVFTKAVNGKATSNVRLNAIVPGVGFALALTPNVMAMIEGHYAAFKKINDLEIGKSKFGTTDRALMFRIIEGRIVAKVAYVF